jgi:hypothetical protein
MRTRVSRPTGTRLLSGRATSSFTSKAMAREAVQMHGLPMAGLFGGRRK